MCSTCMFLLYTRRHQFTVVQTVCSFLMTFRISSVSTLQATICARLAFHVVGVSTACLVFAHFGAWLKACEPM